MVNYDTFSQTFARSRRGLKWEEIEYFMDFISKNQVCLDSVLDIGCGSGRLLETLQKQGVTPKKYLGIDISAGLLKEAQLSFSEYQFQCLDMKGISLLKKEFSAIFLIASFHHLETLLQRQEVLKELYNKTNSGGYVFITNWNLISGDNGEKYKKDSLEDSQNDFGSKDFSISFGENQRYYHGFSLQELEHIVGKTDFELLENRVFEGERNLITILRKK